MLGDGATALQDPTDPVLPTNQTPAGLFMAELDPSWSRLDRVSRRQEPELFLLLLHLVPLFPLLLLPVRVAPPLAEKALSDGFWRVRYSDTSLLIWQQQQQQLEAAPPSNYLSRSQSSWYSRYGNQAVLVRDKRGTDDPEGRSRICSVM
ncbi:putative uncharacterized protein BRD3OS [Scomber scombrus]|uniref:putative uncharacterized protein BRD3OS n=1 Tax=Scomber scombrus TaxID=13677 RepID=UPI002DD95B10|nr:putative uncharacterized protein BRD3OS [Scomber scombrus]